MKKEEALKKKEETKKELNDLYTDILKEMCNKDKYLNERFWQEVKQFLDKPLNAFHYSSYEIAFLFAEIDYTYDSRSEELSEKEAEEYIDERKNEFNEQTKTLKGMLEQYENLKYNLAFGIDRLVDMEMEFDGDIIITDPCYIIKNPDKSTKPKREDYISYSSMKDYPDYDKEKEESEKYFEEERDYYAACNEWDANYDDWSICECGVKMETLGFTKYMTRDTLYGDWSCTTYNLDTKEPIGSFCADAGLVSVFLLDEVMKYNPDYKDVKDNRWCVTCIRDFKGTVEFRVEHLEGTYEETTEYHKAGDKWEDNVVKVYGHGVNKVTGEPINFVGTQTGF